MSKKMTKNYEVAIIVSPSLTNAEIEKKITQIRKNLNKAGKIHAEDIWGMRELAYRIKLQRQGFYALFYLHAEAGALTEFDAEMRIDQDILRHLILTHADDYVPVVRLDEEEGTPSSDTRAREKAAVKAAATKVKVEVEKEEAAPAEKTAEKSEKPVAEPEKKSEPELEKPAEPITEDGVKKKTVSKKKTSLDDLDAALDELLKD